MGDCIALKCYLVLFAARFAQAGAEARDSYLCGGIHVVVKNREKDSSIFPCLLNHQSKSTNPWIMARYSSPFLSKSTGLLMKS